MSHQMGCSAKTNTRWWSYENGRLQLVVAIGVRIQTKWLLFFLKPNFLPLKCSFDSCYFVLDLDNSLVCYFPNILVNYSTKGAILG